MTSAFRRSVAKALTRAAVSTAPPERRVWAEAMRAEVEYLPDSAAPSFAGGCLWTAIWARAASTKFILQTTRWTLVIGATGWATLSIWLAERLSTAAAVLPASLAYIAAGIFGLGALATALFGLRATVMLVTPVLALAMVHALGATVLRPEFPHRALYQALALEQIVVLLMALVIALIVPNWAAARDRIAS